MAKNPSEFTQQRMVSTGIFSLHVSVKMFCGHFCYHRQTGATLRCAPMALEVSSFLFLLSQRSFRFTVRCLMWLGSAHPSGSHCCSNTQNMAISWENSSLSSIGTPVTHDNMDLAYRPVSSWPLNLMMHTRSITRLPEAKPCSNSKGLLLIPHN